jgi:quinol monooxygenase YgiN
MVDCAAGVSFQSRAPVSLVMIEQWESIAHLEAHLQTPHMKAYSEAVKGDVLEMNIRILQPGI